MLSHTQRISEKIGNSQSHMIDHFHDFIKSIQNCTSCTSKILHNFGLSWLSLKRKRMEPPPPKKKQLYKNCLNYLYWWIFWVSIFFDLGVKFCYTILLLWFFFFWVDADQRSETISSLDFCWRWNHNTNSIKKKIYQFQIDEFSEFKEVFLNGVKVMFVTIVEGDQKALFSIATTPRCRGGYYSFPWIAPLYPWYIPYIAEC